MSEPSTPAPTGQTFGEIRDLWQKVHVEFEKKGLTPFDRAYLLGMEEVLDWLMADTCPNGDTRARRQPGLRDPYGYTLMVVPETAVEEHEKDGADRFFPVAKKKEKK